MHSDYFWSKFFSLTTLSTWLTSSQLGPLDPRLSLDCAKLLQEVVIPGISPQAGTSFTYVHYLLASCDE